MVASLLERPAFILFETIFLGTSASAPSIQRSLPALVVSHEEYRFLVDCGEGTQRQILKSGIGFKRLNRILITHSHLDHILGLAGLISTLLRWEAMDDLEIFASPGAMERIHDLVYGVVLRGARNTPVTLTEIGEGPFFRGEDFEVSAFRVPHRHTDSRGFLFEEKGRRPFLPEKAEALDIPMGPWRKSLVDGETVTLPDGRVIEPDQVLGEFKPGTRFVCIGDLGDTRGLDEICREADGLVIEATYLEEDAQMARQFDHLTARQAAELAKRAGVAQLVLTHVSRRYREKDILAEAQEVFPNVQVARDFDTFNFKRSK
jgi:ribonuclease Z